jgi:4-amino-4-deoxy-L-arabinose transferase-like glycosyltransferase
MKLPEIELTTPKKSVMFVLAVCLITFLLKAPSFCENLEWDESIHLFLGRVITYGDGFFSVPWSHHGLVLFTTFAAVYALFGASSEALHTVAALFSVFTAVFIYLLSRSLFDARVAVFASLFFAIFSSSRSMQGTLAAVEVFTIFFTTLGFYLYVLYRQRDSGRILVLSGIALGTALLYKQTSGLDYLCLVLFILAEGLYSYKGDKLRAEIIWPITLLTVGFLLPLIALAIFFFATDRLFDFIYWTFIKGFYYAKMQHAYAPGWHGFVAVVTGNTWMIWLLSLLGVVSSILFMHSKYRLFCVLWMALVMIGVSLSGWFSPTTSFSYCRQHLFWPPFL